MGDGAVSMSHLILFPFVLQYLPVFMHGMHLQFDVVVTLTTLRFNVLQYPWNSNEMYLFKTNMAYALRQYYSQKNQTLPFTSVSPLLFFFIFMFLLLPLKLDSLFPPADQRTFTPTTKLPGSPFTWPSAAHQVQSTSRRVIWRLPSGETPFLCH